MVELESEEVFKAEIDSPTHLGPVELVFEDKSATTGGVKTDVKAPD